MEKRVKNVFEYLKDKNINSNTKEMFINKKKSKIIKSINKLEPKKIIDYLFDSSLPNSVKKIISDEINNLENKNTKLSQSKINEIEEYIKEKNISTESMLRKDYYPNILKKYIIDKNYNKDIISLISDKSINLKNKKAIIDLKATSEDLITLLKEDVSIEISNYIIDTKIVTVSQIQSVLSSYSRISDEIKDEVIKKKINSKNILDVLFTYLYTEELVERIFILKKDEIAKYINNLRTNTLLKTINLTKMKEPLANKIIELRKEDLEKEVKKLNKNNITEVLLDSKVPKLSQIILDNKEKTVLKSVPVMYSFYLLSFLNNPYIPDHIKEYTISKRSKHIDSEIKRLSANRIRLFYLNKDTNLPIQIQQRMFEIAKPLFLEEIKNYNEKELIESITYGTSSNIIRTFMIQEGINEKNIFKFLYELEHHLDLAHLTITLKKDIIEKFLIDFPEEDILNLYGVKVSAEIANLIIELNKEIVAKKLKEFDRSVLIESLTHVDTLYEIKKLILESFDIYDSDFVNCLQIINEDNCELLINNYNKIKIFLVNSGIDFQTFMQYGSGSKNYSDWFIDIIDIINNNKIDEFINIKNYFFSNYYSGEEKENAVYIIENFLELLQNFSKNYELCLNVSSENKKLTKEDKLNISFLFKVRSIDGLSMPKTLEELSTFKLNLYNSYIKRINSKNASITELQDIFNDLIFYNADEVLYNIGGTRALKTLKKDNCNSKYICSLIDDLLLYSTIIEKVNRTNNKDGLIKVLKYIFEGDLSNLTRLQNIFLGFEEKVLKLYELDSQFNLTKLSNVKEKYDVIDQELSLKYGGEVYNFSDKNYVLYGHALSHKENMDNLVNGISTGKSNFISVSPISYMGQKYYYNMKNLIVAFDKIPTGSFVCSSISNMGTNYSINNNSYEVKEINRKQRGILETSAVTKNNSEALLYREGLKPCGLILPGGKIPNELEREYHTKYNLPFIITQGVNKAIDSPKMVFNNTDDRVFESDVKKELQDILNLLEPTLVLDKETDVYTGREIAIFTDCHSMYEPTIEVLENIRKRGITEIYSLGDNVGLGPNPKEVFDLLEEYDVKSVAGNSEYYNTLGTEPFNYFYPEKIKSQEWTQEQLGTHRINKLKLYPASIDIIVGDKKIALCHFANDVRWDFVNNSTWTYQANFESGTASKQFLNTNSEDAKILIENYIVSHKGDKRANGFISSKNEPLFDGKIITDYDSVFQGHVHFEMNDKLNNTDIYTLRAIGMGYKNKDEEKACYYILKEKKDGSFDIEKKLVDFNKNRLISSIYTCGIPEKEKVLRFVKGK